MKRSASALLLLPALLLAGCTVAYDPPPSESTGDAPSVVEVSPSPSATSAPTTTLRTTYGAEADRTSCAAGEVVIEQSAGIIAIDGDCASVRIIGSGAIVLADRVGTLIVEGSATRIQVAEVDAVELAGSGNEVRWDAGEPLVNDTGAGNSARPTKG